MKIRTILIENIDDIIYGNCIQFHEDLFHVEQLMIKRYTKMIKNTFSGHIYKVWMTFIGGSQEDSDDPVSYFLVYLNRPIPKSKETIFAFQVMLNQYGDNDIYEVYNYPKTMTRKEMQKYARIEKI